MKRIAAVLTVLALSSILQAQSMPATPPDAPSATSAPAAAKTPVHDPSPILSYRFKTLVSFDGISGGVPLGGLSMDSAGNLYGLARDGRAPDVLKDPDPGMAFKLDAANGYALSILKNPIGTTAETSVTIPTTGLIMDKTGNLYGTTGVTPRSGHTLRGKLMRTIFRLDASKGYALKTLTTSAELNGASFGHELVMDGEGNLYGVASDGGTTDNGLVFKLDASKGYRLSTLVNFTGANGRHPTDLTIDATGNLYGDAEADIQPAPQGAAAPRPGPKVFADEPAYPLAMVFKLDASNRYALSTLFTFDKAHRYRPACSLIVDPTGNLYGATMRGGPDHDIAVFKLDASRHYAISTLTTLSELDQQTRINSLTMDTQGNFYGTTLGDKRASNTVFKLDAARDYAVSTLVTFAGPNGSNCLAGLMLDAAGNIFGTTYGGGDDGKGTVFEIKAVREGDAAATDPAVDSTPATTAKLPVPPEKDVTAARKIITDRLSKEYSAVAAVQGQEYKLYEAMRPLEVGLTKFSTRRNEPAVRYAAKLLLIERNLFEPANAMAIYYDTNRLSQEYDLSSDARCKLIVDLFTKVTTRPRGGGRITFAACLAIEEMIDREQFEQAKTLAQIAVKDAQFGIKILKPDPGAIKFRDNMVKETSLLLSKTTEIEAARKKVQPFLETLKTTPDDEEANTEVGTFLCYFKRDWKAGLAKMALGKDQATKTIAAEDIKATTASEKIAVAQKWLDIAAKSNGSAKAAIEHHYRNLYHAACSAIADGETLKVDAKLDGGPQYQANLRKLVGKSWEVSDQTGNNVMGLAENGTAARGGPHPTGTWSIDADTVTVRFGEESFRFQLPIDATSTIIEDENGRFVGLAAKQKK